MKKSFPKFSALLVLLVALLGYAAGSGVQMQPGTRFEIDNCPSGGSSSSTTLPTGDWLFRVSADEGTWICYATTCAAAGEWFPANFVMMLHIEAGNTGQRIECHSTGSTGDVIFTKAG